MAGTKKTCLKCKKDIKEKDLHKIVIYIVQEKFTEHHYEHVECPERFTVWKFNLEINKDLYVF